MADDILDKVLTRGERTNVRSTSLTCENYTLFSCPKEILDIFQRAANTMLAGGALPATFITPSLLSDMNLKSRITAVVKNSLFGVVALLVMAVSFPFFYLEGGRLYAALVLLATLAIGFTYVGGYGYWYGKIEGMRVDEGISVKVCENSSKVFRNTTMFLVASKSLAMYVALFFLYLSTPHIFYGMQRVANKPAMANLVQHAFGTPFFNELNKVLSALGRTDFTSLPYLFAGEVVLYGAGLWIATSYGMKIGKKESEKEARETFRKYASEQKYTFEKALGILTRKDQP